MSCTSSFKVAFISLLNVSNFTSLIFVFNHGGIFEFNASTYSKPFLSPLT